MTQLFADALTWMPKSRALGSTLTRAHDIARAHGHGSVLLEHLLQALIEDPDASAVLLSCNIDLLGLNAAVSTHVQAQPANGSSQPEASQSLLLILEYAAAAARQSKRPDVNGAIVLAAMAGEGKSDAARMLKTAGLKFEDTIAALRRVAATPRPAAEPPPVQAEPPVPVPPPYSTNPYSTTVDSTIVDSTTLGSTTLATQVVAEHTAGAPQLPTLTATQTGSAPRPMPMPAAFQPPAALSRPTPADEDPLTTARRRVAALKAAGSSAQVTATGATADAPIPAPATAPMAGHMFGSVSASGAAVAVDAGAATWAPMPQPAAAQTTARTVRMPPPVPPIADRPPQSNVVAYSNGAEARNGAALRAPWADPVAENTSIEPLQQGSSAAPIAGSATTFSPTTFSPTTGSPTTGSPIEVNRLGENVPRKMQERQSVTVEARISRSAVLATAAAMRVAANEGRDTALTRAVTVRIRAPSGGFHVETAAPETQWFDSRSSRRDDEVVRWRWIVTPHGTGTKPLQISVSIRTIAADGTMIETVLPEHEFSVRVGSNYREGMRRLGRAAIAVSAGVALTLLATGGLASVFGPLFR